MGDDIGAFAVAPLVSVCIPTYNGSQFLGDCLASVLGQTYPKLEIVIVDDGSSDGTISIAKQYAAADRRIRVVQNKANVGECRNIGRCIEIAGGEWVKIVFQDDLIAPECVERLVGAAQTSVSKAIVFGKRKFIFSPSVPESVQSFYLTHPSNRMFDADREVLAEDFCRLTLMNPCVNMLGEPTASLIHRGVFLRYGSFNPALSSIGDLEFWTRVATNTGVIVVSEEIASFRVHSESSSAMVVHGAREPRGSRIHILDRAVLYHDYAYGPSYVSLRRAADKCSPYIDLKDRAAMSARDAYAVLQEVSANPEQADPLLLRKCAVIAESYPLLLVGRLPSALAHLLDRCLGSGIKLVRPIPRTSMATSRLS